MPFPKISADARSHVGAALAFALVLALLVPSVLSAQESTAEGDPLVGRVLLNGNPVAGSVVTLHRITPEQSGEMGAAVSDSAGQFRFNLVPVPNAEFNVFLTTADYLGIRFFGPVIHPDSAGQDYVVEVYDTAYA